MAEFSDPDFLNMIDVGRFPCTIFKTSDIERSVVPGSLWSV